MTAKHARPGRPGLVRISGRTAGRRLAAGAIILAAGAAPLLAGSGAQADSTSGGPGPAAAEGAGAAPLVGGLPLDLDSPGSPAAAAARPGIAALAPAPAPHADPASSEATADPAGVSGIDGLTSLNGLAAQALPLGSILPSAHGAPSLDGTLPLVGSVPAITGALPLGSLTGAPANQARIRAQTGRLLPRSAPEPLAADPLASLGALNPLGPDSPATPMGLSSLAQNSVTSLADSTSGTLGSIGQEVPPGGVGALTSGFTPQADALTGMILHKSTPVVNQLQQRGVPTVGDLTNQVGDTSLPMIGPVGHLTQTLPLSTVLGTENPLADALSTATQL